MPTPGHGFTAAVANQPERLKTAQTLDSSDDPTVSVTPVTESRRSHVTDVTARDAGLDHFAFGLEIPGGEFKEDCLYVPKRHRYRQSPRRY